MFGYVHDLIFFRPFAPQLEQDVGHGTDRQSTETFESRGSNLWRGGRLVRPGSATALGQWIWGAAPRTRRRGLHGPHRERSFAITVAAGWPGHGRRRGAGGAARPARRGRLRARRR